MYQRFLVGSVFILLVVLAFSVGCSTTPPGEEKTTSPIRTEVPVKTAEDRVPAPVSKPTTSPSDITAQLAAVKSTNPVWLEAYRIFNNMKTTEYVHTTFVDEAKGIYRFDCLGFVDYVLQNGAPAAFKSAGHGYERPELVVYADYFRKLDATPNADGWSRIAHPIDLKPGDICLWQKGTSDSVGHMWIIAGAPRANPDRKEEVLVRILDSDGVHGDDSRAAKSYKYGLGTGVMGMMVDPEGNPNGLYWEGGNLTSTGIPDPTIVCGRYNK
jgi:hypothetical protein